MNSQKHTTTISPRKSLSRIILQIFVWALVIAFVSTLGVMWDGSAGGFPVVIKSSKGEIDLSPSNLYMMEYNKLDEELRTNNSSIDPRMYTRYIKHASLTNAENTYTRQLFYQAIDIKPSPKSFQDIQMNSGLSSNFIDFQYAENYFLNPIGILPVLASPTVSDMYALHNLRNLQIATEMLVLNKTNFLYSMVTDEDIYSYYQQNFEKWLDSITVQEIHVENRGQARKVINSIKELGVEQFLSSPDNSVSKDKVITVDSSNYTYVNEILLSYKSNKTIVGPLYNKGQYSVVIITNINPFEQLHAMIQNRVVLDFIEDNYDQLAKKYDSDWKTSINTFQVSEDESFSSVNITGVINHTLQPFTMIQTSVTNVLGASLALPLLSSPEFIRSVLYTPLNKASDTISINNEIYTIVRPLLRDHQQQNQLNAESIYNDPEIYQDTLQYKNYKLNESLNSDMLKNKFKITTHPKELTNIN